MLLLSHQGCHAAVAIGDGCLRRDGCALYLRQASLVRVMRSAHQGNAPDGARRLYCLIARRILTNSTWPLHSVNLERSEEHTSELQSRSDLVCRLLLEKKKKKKCNQK